MSKLVSRGGLIFEYTTMRGVSAEACPLTGKRGKRLFRETLANHLNPEYWPDIEDNGFYFCDVQNCPVVYFNPHKQLYYSERELHTRVMHKIPISTENRPACYCKNVLEETILDELLHKKCCDSLIDIQNFTQANTGRNCKITNPSGRCCGKQIKEILEWAKEHRLEIDPPLLKEAESCCARIEQNTRLEE